MTRDEVLATLPGYVLDALEPQEKRAIDEYLRRHPDMMARVRELNTTASALAYAAPDKPLPAGAKPRIMQRVRADVQEEKLRIATHPNQTPPFAPRAGPRPPQRNPQRPAPPRPAPTPQARGGFRRWWAERRYANLALVMACALAVLLVVAVIQSQSMLRTANANLAQLQARVATLEADNQSLAAENRLLQQDAVEQRRQWTTILTAEQAVALDGTPDAPQARAVFYAGGQELLVVATGLASLPEGRTYQLWLMPAQGDPVPAGLFAAGEEGATTFAAALPLPLNAYRAVSVSIEPAGGSPGPTGPIVLMGEVG